MHPGVQNVLHEFLSRFEGVRRGMYLDAVGLVTTGIGFMFPTPAEARRLRWAHPARRAATGEEVEREWHRVKDSRSPVDGESPLLLTSAEVDRVFANQVRSRESILRHVFPAWDTYPADAQLGMLAHSWLASSRAGIEGWQGGRYVQAIRETQWDTAGKESLWGALRNPTQPRQVQRREAMLKMFHNAAIVQDAVSRGTQMPVSLLFYPNDALPAVLMRERHS